MKIKDIITINIEQIKDIPTMNIKDTTTININTCPPRKNVTFRKYIVYIELLNLLEEYELRLMIGDRIETELKTRNYHKNQYIDVTSKLRVNIDFLKSLLIELKKDFKAFEKLVENSTLEALSGIKELLNTDRKDREELMNSYVYSDYDYYAIKNTIDKLGE